MEINYTILTYFNYDIEKVLDEFNNYYNTKQNKIPIHFRSIYLYFSNLSEIGMQTLISNKYNIKQAKDVTKLIPIHTRYVTKQEFLNNMHSINISPIHYYGLLIYSYYFYEIFLQYIKYDQEKALVTLASNIPIIEHNIKLAKTLIKSPHK